MWLFCTLFASWFTTFARGSPSAGVLSLRPGGIADQIIPGTYLFAFLGVLVGTAVWLWSPRHNTRPPTAKPAAGGESSEFLVHPNRAARDLRAIL
jgi:alpha-1,2-mannosyltransferase